MADFPKLNIILLALVAVANVATEVARVALEWSPSRPLHKAVMEWLHVGNHDVFAPEARHDGLAPKGVPREIRPLDPPAVTRGPRPERPEYPTPPYVRSLPEYRPGRMVLWGPDCLRPSWRYEPWRTCRWWRYEAR
jgi:hypothetical protein